MDVDDPVTTGEFPADGKENNISYPDPSTANVEFGGLKLINLRTLINYTKMLFMNLFK